MGMKHLYIAALSVLCLSASIMAWSNNTGRAEAGNVLQDAAVLVRHTQGYDLNRRVASLEIFAETVLQDSKELHAEVEKLRDENKALQDKVNKLQSIVSYLSSQ